MVVAWNMSERKEFAHVFKTKTSDSIILAITFLLTVLTNLTTAVEAGLFLAVIIFVKRMRDILTVTKVLPDPSMKNEKVKSYMVNEGHDCPQVGIYTIEGPLFFGAANMFEKSIMDTLHLHPRVLLLRMGKVPFIDATGESNLASIVKHFKKSGGSVLISGIQPQPITYMKKTGLDQTIGEDHFFDHTGEAITYALKKLDYNKCLGCNHLAFRECTALSTRTGQQEAVEQLHATEKASKQELGLAHKP